MSTTAPRRAPRRGRGVQPRAGDAGAPGGDRDPAARRRRDARSAARQAHTARTVHGRRLGVPGRRRRSPRTRATATSAHRRGGDPRVARGGRDRARGPRRAREVLALDHPGRGAHALRHPLLPRAAARRPGAEGRWRGVRRSGLVHARRRRSRPIATSEIVLVFPTIKHLEQLRRLLLGRRAADLRSRPRRCSRSSHGSWSRARSHVCCYRVSPAMTILRETSGHWCQH